MSDTESDEDLQKAIALSLMSPEPKEPKTVIVVDTDDDDDDDDDLDRPVTAKPTRANIDKKPSPPTESVRENVADSSKSSEMLPSSEAEAAPMASGLLGLNRRQMENERLARAARRKRAEEDVSMSAVPSRKRKASTSPTHSRGAIHQLRDRRLGDILESFTTAKTERESDTNSAWPAEGVLNILQSNNNNMVSEIGNTQTHEHIISSPDSLKARSSAQAHRPPVVGIQYPDGVVKKTWVFGYPRQGDDIKIEEVLQKNDLELAVLSSFQLDADWIMSKLDDKTKIVWVLQAKDEDQKRNWASGAPKNFRFCFPPMDGNVNCMHSKLQLLAHPTHLRIAVPSANLTPYDWGETGVMENVCFLIDLPRLPDGQETDLKRLTPFGRELLHFLHAMGLDKGQINSMRRFDFSRTAHLAFVHSIGGSHTGTQLSTTGLCGLGRAVRDLGLNTKGALNIDFLAASIGSLNENFLRSMYLAAQGDDGSTEYGWRTNEPARGKRTEEKVSDDLESCCRIYYPSRETVEQSKGGVSAGGTICFQSKWWLNDTFPRSLMRDCKSQRSGLLMHSKMIFVRPEKTSCGSVAWAYVGSANLSESAWGRLVKKKSAKEQKLLLRNWECGVILPMPRPIPPAGEAADREAGVGNRFDMSVFHGHLPVPMVVPGEEYGGRRPWFYNEQ